MWCSTEGCEWNGQLDSCKVHRTDTETRCGLCMNPVSEGPPVEAAPALQVQRRDQDAEEQQRLSAEADALMVDTEHEAPKPSRRGFKRRESGE